MSIVTLAEQFRSDYNLTTDDFVSLGEDNCNFHDALHAVFSLAPTTHDEVLVTLLENYFKDGSRLPRRGKQLIANCDPNLLSLLSDFASTL